MSKSLIKSQIVCALVLAFMILPARGANILLREVSTHQGSVVYLGDVADISAGTASEIEKLVTMPLMAAPAPGIQNFLQAGQVRDLLTSRGIDVTTLSIAGARTVEVGKADATRNLLAIKPNPTLTPTQSEEAVITAVEQHLVNSTGHEDWQIDLDLDTATLTNLAKLGVELEASAGRSPWTGTQRFQIIGMDSATTVPVIARVVRLHSVVVALRKIEAGNLIGAPDVEVRLQGGNVPVNVVTSLDQVIGKEALRSIEVDSTVQTSQFRAPLQVQRGETVRVFARTGGITVSTFAVVQQDGSLGDLVQVQTADKKSRFAARVSGWKQLEVLPTGATTGDYASSNNVETQRR